MNTPLFWREVEMLGIPIYLRREDLDIVSKTAYYLVDRTQMTSGGTVAILGLSNDQQ